jgi:flagellar biosynthesis component FlhA
MKCQKRGKKGDHSKLVLFFLSFFLSFFLFFFFLGQVLIIFQYSNGDTGDRTKRGKKTKNKTKKKKNKERNRQNKTNNRNIVEETAL